MVWPGEAAGSLARGAEAVFWERLEERRGKWALLMLRAALLLKASRGDDEWRSFAASRECIVFFFSDRVVQEKLGFWREDRGGA